MPQSPSPPPSPPVYSEATDKVFRRALVDLKKRLPDHHVGLAALLEARTFHDAAAIKQLITGEAE